MSFDYNPSGLPEEDLTPVYNTPTPLSVILKRETRAFISSNNNHLLNERSCCISLLDYLNSAVGTENTVRGKDNKLSYLKELPHLCIAMLIAARGDVALVSPGDKSQSNQTQPLTLEQRHKLPIGIFQTSGDNKGVYEITNSPYEAFGELVERYKADATRKDKLEVFALVKNKLQVRQKCVIPYFVAVNNGIWDMKQKVLHKFTPDLVFTSKIHTNLNLYATNPVITIPEDNSTWDVDGWFDSLGSLEFVESVKEAIQAACVPLAPRNQMCLFYSKVGNNGKGTICQLVRNLLGEDVVVSIPLADFSEKFALANLPRAVAVVTDENNVNSFNKGLANLKAAITGDVLKIERKYMDAYNYAFHGLILECVNAYPKGDDKTGSFKRRLHIIGFENCFTGVEKRYIKDRLIYRRDVLEYILKMVLVDMDYRESFTQTAATKKLLYMYVMATNAVVAFLEEILPACRWDLLPATDFLYEAFKFWYKKTFPSGKVIGRNDFIDSVKEFVATDPVASLEWEWTDSTRSKGYIPCPSYEPLINEYDIVAFADNNYYPGDTRRAYVQKGKLKDKYSGLKRRIPSTAAGAVNGTTVTPTDTEED